MVDEVTNQIQRAIEFRRDGEHSYVGTSRGDLLKNVGAGEFPVRVSTRQPETLEGLSPFVIRADEIALEMCRQHSRRRGRRTGTAFPHRREQPAEDRWRTCDRGRAKCGDAKTRQPIRHPPDRVFVVERIRPLDAVNVYVNESWHDEMTGEIRRSLASGHRSWTRADFDDDFAVDRDGSWTQYAIGQDDVSAGEDDHVGRSAAPQGDWSSGQWILRPSSGSGPAPSARNTVRSACLRRERSRSSSGAQSTMTPAPSAGGKWRSSM